MKIKKFKDGKDGIAGKITKNYGIVDIGIASKNQSFRMLYQGKKNDKRVLIPYGNSSADWKKHLCCAYNIDESNVILFDSSKIPTHISIDAGIFYI